MKALLFILTCLIFFISEDIYSQINFQAGPIVGVGICNIQDNNQPDFRIHGHAGILTKLQINRKLNLQPSIMLSNKGYWYPSESRDNKLKLTYLDLIVNLKYQLHNLFYIGAGLQTGYLLNSKYIFLAYGTDYYDTINIDNATNKFDLGLNGCLGIQFRNGIGLEFSLLCGIRDIFNANKSEVFQSEYYNYPRRITNDVDGKNRVISTSFFYLFGKK